MSSRHSADGGAPFDTLTGGDGEVLMVARASSAGSRATMGLPVDFAPYDKPSGDTPSGSGSSSSTGGSGSYQGAFLGNWKKCKHPGNKPVVIGGLNFYLGAKWDISAKTFADVDVICPLNGNMPDKLPFGTMMHILSCELQDRGGVPKNWAAFLHKVISFAQKNKKILAYCTGSHGRTGCFGASLIALLEPDIEDPIDEIRKRHCEEAVESHAQAKAIFALKGQKLPEKYEKEFRPPVSISSGGSSSQSQGYQQASLVKDSDLDAFDKATWEEWLKKCVQDD